jgi:N utilization substance protein B
MQSIYAMHQNGSDNLEKEEKFLLQYRQHSRFIPYNDFFLDGNIKELNFLHKSSLKHLATPEERKPNEKFIKNSISNSCRKQFS